VREPNHFADHTTAHQAGGGPTRQLLVLWDGGTAHRDLPERGAIVLGRGAECDVQIEHPSVSRRHATLHVGPSYALEDHGSSNGTRVDGRQVPEGKRVPVSTGQHIELGSTTLVLPAIPLSPPAAGHPTALHATPPGSPMRELHDTLDLVARGTIAVLVIGETGVGKELVAAELHRRSPRAGRPFLTLNCASFPEALLETELFGFERGAFAGAEHPKPGLVEVAAGGTVLLDEVSALPLTIQAKLLRLLESGEVMRVGSLHAQRVDVRFVATSNRDLEQLVATERFRADLYYRLNGAKLVVPPLRDRRTEIAPLARGFAAAAAAQLGIAPGAITAPALLALERHSWPGNVRELRNVIERAVLLARGAPIGIEHVGAASAAASPNAPAANPSQPPPAAVGPSGDLRAQLNVIERERILAALVECNGNQSRAAKLLGMPRRTFLSRLDALQIARPRKGSGNES
jgi:two-component system, NtrC family, response regulator AtoC